MSDSGAEFLERDAIHRCASDLRDYFESGREGSEHGCLRMFPRGCCKVVSILVLMWINHRYGVRGRLVANACRPDDSTHAWASIGGVIVDITANQFDDFDQRVFVAESSRWHDSFDGAREIPYEESATNLTEELMREFGKLVSALEST